MPSRRAVGLLGLILLATMSGPSSARAWSRTVVHSARATVTVERDATVYVLLRLDVQVHAGWLKELELVDLGPNVELDRYRPPYFRSAEGEVLRPEAELHDDGRIRLWFDRREAPRRGEYRVYMRYRTSADARVVEVAGIPRARVVWSVPAWETGLHDVSVELRAPKGTVVPDDLNERSPGINYDVTEHPNRTIVRWRRIHLPRTTAWPLTIDAPGESIALPEVGEPSPMPNGFRPMEREEEHPVAWALLLVAVLALVKRQRLERRWGSEALLLPAPSALVAVGSAALVGVAQWLDPLHLAWGAPLAALAFHRRLGESSIDAGRVWRHASFADLRTKHVPDLLDATDAYGMTVLVALSALLFAVDQPTGSLLLLPVFFTGTRWNRAPNIDESAALLRAFASRLRLPDHTPPLCFAWERAEDAPPRLRAHMPTSRAGLRAVSFCVASTAVGLTYSRGVMLLVETRAQSNADDLMRRRTVDCDSVRGRDGSVLRLVPWNDEAMELLRALARQAPKPVKASRGTWLLREISKPGRRAA